MGFPGDGDGSILTNFDHLFVVLFAIVYPIAGYVGFLRLLRRIEAGEPVNRIELYRNTILGHWLLFALLLSTWFGTGRNQALPGFALLLNRDFLIGGVITLACIALLLQQLVQVGRSGHAKIDRLERQLGRLEPLIPHTRAELRKFNLVGVTAGFVEEALWRGYLLWYLGQSMPLWLAAIVSATGFAVAHAYQGVENLPRIALVGIVFVGLYLLTGSIWLPVALHIAVDLLQGRVAFEICSRRSERTQPASS